MSAKFLLVLIFFGVPAHCFSQLQEIHSKASWTVMGEVKWINTTKARLQFTSTGKDTSYWLYLKDEKTLKNTRDMPVLNYFSIHFDNEGDALPALKNLLFSFFEDSHARDKTFEKTFRLGNSLVLVQHAGKLTGKSILLTTREGSIILSKREIQKLLGG